MDAVYPAAASALARGRRRRRPEPRQRHRTMPVTFAEIKEVDEEKLECEHESAASVTSVVSAVEERRRRPDVLDERLGAQFAEFRRRRRRERVPLREPDEVAASSTHAATGAPAEPACGELRPREPS